MSASELLRLPVRLHGIRLGRPVDLLLAAAAWRAVGFLVRCGDGSERFLAFAAAEARSGEIAVPSALLLLEYVEFYRRRTRSLRSLLGTAVASGTHELGELRDVRLAPDGSVVSLVVATGDGLSELPPGSARTPTSPLAAG
ncbi:MAG TPA: hypothetical protein VE995_02830 [Gaiellaceae bacterium]|nr:hypothetical protein [Gaiellaceae bacterium]